MFTRSEQSICGIQSGSLLSVQNSFDTIKRSCDSCSYSTSNPCKSSLNLEIERKAKITEIKIVSTMNLNLQHSVIRKFPRQQATNSRCRDGLASKFWGLSSILNVATWTTITRSSDQGFWLVCLRLDQCHVELIKLHMPGFGPRVALRKAI